MIGRCPTFRSSRDPVLSLMPFKQLRREHHTLLHGPLIQVNAVQLDSNPLIPLVATMYSAIQGSRAGYISTKVHEMFEGIAAGRAEGIDTDTFSKRFIRAPIPSPFSD